MIGSKVTHVGFGKMLQDISRNPSGNDQTLSMPSGTENRRKTTIILHFIQRTIS